MEPTMRTGDWDISVSLKKVLEEGVKGSEKRVKKKARREARWAVLAMLLLLDYH